MKNYRTEIAAVVFLALLLLSILLASPWREQQRTDAPPLETFPTAVIDRPTPNQTAPALRPTATANVGTVDGARFPECNGAQNIICLVAVGIDNLSGDTVFSINTPDPGLADLYLLVSNPFSNRYECQLVATTQGLLYCSGEFLPEGTQVNIEVYTRAESRLVAAGAYIMPFASPIDTSGAGPTQPSYPSYPSYP